MYVHFTSEGEINAQHVESANQGNELVEELVWAASWVVADLGYAIWDYNLMRKAVAASSNMDASGAITRNSLGFEGSFPQLCQGVEIAAGGAETAVTYLTTVGHGGNAGTDNVNTVDGLDYGITAICSGYGARSLFRSAVATSISARAAATTVAAARAGSNAVALIDRQVALEAANKEALKAVRNLAGGVVSAICNAAEAATSFAAVGKADDTRVTDANRYTDFACSIAGLLVAVLTWDPVMGLVSAISLIIQGISMWLPSPTPRPIPPMQVYAEAYEYGQFLTEPQEFLLFPLLFYSGLHSNDAVSSYGLYIQAVDYEQTIRDSDTFNPREYTRTLYPKVYTSN